MLYIFGGLPGTGKSTLAAALARHVNALYLRLDTIEQAMRTSGIEIDGPAGYIVAYGVARENLRLGRSVVADSVNPIAITREAWTDVAREVNVAYIEIEVICSDLADHRRRVETRRSDVPGLRLPTWAQVVSREYEPWAGPHILIDTAAESAGASIQLLLAQLSN